MLSDTARAIVGAADQRSKERWNGDRPLFDTALTLGDFRIAEAGAECWARTDGDIALLRMAHDGEARGGIILDITADPDPETGDMRRAFRVFDPYAPLWQAVTVLQESMIDPQSFSPPNLGRIRNAYRRLCREIGSKRGAATSTELEMVANAGRLAAILARSLG
jgi:hypothetical protein